MRKARNLWLSIVILTLLLWGGNAHSAIIGFEPASQNAFLGGTFNIDLVISDLGNFTAPSLGAFDLNLDFDPGILSFSSYQLGTYLGDTSLVEAFDVSAGLISPGTINLAELSLLDVTSLEGLQASSFVLATLTFTGFGVGSTSLDLSVKAIGDSFGDTLPYSLNNGSVNVVSPVPEPCSILLFSSGLVGIAALRKRFIQS